MFFAASADGYRPLELAGTQRTEDILQLQQALRELAILTRHNDFNPGPAIGTVSKETMRAVKHSLDLLYGHLPQQVQEEIKESLRHDEYSTELKNIIGRHAGLLATASRNVAHQIASGRAAHPFHGLSADSSFFSADWTSDPGKLAIVGGSVLATLALVAMVFSKRKRAKR